MAKFTYRMQNILDIKIKLEEQAKQEYAEAQYRHRLETEKLEGLKDRRLGYIDEMRGYASDSLNVMELDRMNDAIFVMDEKIREQKDQVFRALAEEERAKEKLNISMQERKTHEKLKEHQFESFLQELNSEEMKEVDELVSYKYNSNDSNEINDSNEEGD